MLDGAFVEDERSCCDLIITFGLPCCVCMVLSVLMCLFRCGCRRLPDTQAGEEGNNHDLDKPLSERTMLRISNEFTNVDSCLTLAICLGLKDGSNFVASFNPLVNPMSEVAFRILKQWIREKGAKAGRGALHHVLEKDLCRPSVAAQLTETADNCCLADTRGELSMSEWNGKLHGTVLTSMLSGSLTERIRFSVSFLLLRMLTRCMVT